MRWFISDTHFGHANVIEYSKRPFVNAEQMDDIMIGRWNNVVRPNDEVFMLGAFGLSSVQYLTDVLQSLNGSKILIRGNHDGSVAKMKRIGFDAVLEEANIYIDGYNVNLCHYPREEVSEVVRLHGHIHELGKPYFEKGQLCMCVELWNYMPVSEKVVQKLIKQWENDGNTCSRKPRGRGSETNAGGSQI